MFRELRRHNGERGAHPSRTVAVETQKETDGFTFTFTSALHNK